MEKINKFKNFWFKISDKIRFLIIGAFNAGVSFLIFSALCLILGENFYHISLAFSWIISSIISFTTQRILVFNVKGNLFKQYFKCCTTWIISYTINALLLELFVRKLSLNVYVSQILATLACAISTYTLFKTFAFRNNPNLNQETQN